MKSAANLSWSLSVQVLSLWRAVHMQNILGKISLLFGHLAGGIGRFMFTGMIAALAFYSLSTLVKAPFEYGFNVENLALLDVVALLLLGWSVWRFGSRGRQSGASWGDLSNRFAFILAFTSLLLDQVLLRTHPPDVFAHQIPFLYHLNLGGDQFLYTSYCVFIAAIFISTPLPSVFESSTVKSGSDDQDDNQQPDEDCPAPPTLNSEAQIR